MQTQTQSQTQSPAYLEDLVYRCVNNYVIMRNATSTGIALMEAIEHEKRSMPLTAAEREALVDELTQRAWERVAAEQPDLFESAEGGN